jgi:simple sugar transport system permease protein
MWLYGYDVGAAYYWLFKGAFGSLEDAFESLAFATPLMLTAITFLVGWKSGLFNIGAEGQLYMGAIGAAWIGGTIALPVGVHVAAATVVGMFFGVLWALPVIFLKWRGAHEVVSTIMLNWIAFSLVGYLVIYRLAMPGEAFRTIPAMESARYPFLAAGTTLTAAIFVALAFCIAVYVLLWRTKLGYELRLAGDNPDAAKYAGVSIRRVIFFNFIIGGLAAGLAGATQVLGRPPIWGVYETLGNLYMLGFVGIGVALIGRNHPIGAIFAAIFYGGLLHGGTDMQLYAEVMAEIVVAIQGIIVFTLAAPELLPFIREKIGKVVKSKGGKRK